MIIESKREDYTNTPFRRLPKNKRKVLLFAQSCVPEDIGSNYKQLKLNDTRTRIMTSSDGYAGDNRRIVHDLLSRLWAVHPTSPTFAQYCPIVCYDTEYNLYHCFAKHDVITNKYDNTFTIHKPFKFDIEKIKQYGFADERVYDAQFWLYEPDTSLVTL